MPVYKNLFNGSLEHHMQIEWQIHSKKISEPMLSNWILHRRHIHWGNTCLFLPPTTCFTVTVNEIKDTQFVLLI